VLFRRKPIGDRTTDTGLRRSLGALDLTLLGVGAIIGAGIFVLTGVAAATQAGPSIIVSYVIAASVCALAALSYAELAAAIGGSGGAYCYAYAGLGEIVAWFVGWALMLEYGLAVSAVAIGWSAYFTNALTSLGVALPKAIAAGPDAGGMVNLPALGIIAALTVLLCLGIEASRWVNRLAVAIKLAVVGLFIVIAAGHVEVANWQPFAPFGFSGIMSGAAIIFFSYIGFDAVCTAADEARNPQRDLPIGILASLALCTALYMLVAALLTGIVDYRTLDNASPVAQAMLDLGFTWFAGVIAFGAVAGLTTVILVIFYGQTRILMAIARDGLLPVSLARVNPRTCAPTNSIVGTGIVVAAIAGFAPIGTVAQLTNIGTLAAFMAVCGAVIALRRRHPALPRPFRMPLVPLLPGLGMLGCLWLMSFLGAATWIYFALWIGIGSGVYFLYSIRTSALARSA